MINIQTVDHNKKTKSPSSPTNIQWIQSIESNGLNPLEYGQSTTEKKTQKQWHSVQNGDDQKPIPRDALSQKSGGIKPLFFWFQFTFYFPNTLGIQS